MVAAPARRGRDVRHASRRHRVGCDKLRCERRHHGCRGRDACCTGFSASLVHISLISLGNCHDGYWTDVHPDSVQMQEEGRPNSLQLQERGQAFVAVSPRRLLANWPAEPDGFGCRDISRAHLHLLLRIFSPMAACHHAVGLPYWKTPTPHERGCVMVQVHGHLGFAGYTDWPRRARR